MSVFLNVVSVLLTIAFVASAFLLIVVILLQEGKGGGIAEAFGGAGGETFGVRASGISRFTGWVAFSFMATAVLIPMTQKEIDRRQNPFQEIKQEAPENPEKVETPPKEPK